MKESNLPQLLTFLGRCGQGLRTAVIEQTKSDFVPSMPPLRLTWDCPPLKLLGGFPGIYFKDIPPILYGESVTAEEGVKAWDHCVGLLRKPDPDSYKAVLATIEPIFPHLPFTSFRANVKTALLQYLIASSWSFGKLSLTKSEVLLSIGGKHLGMTGLSLVSSTSSVRMTDQRTMDFSAIAALTIGPSTKALKSTSALHRHLVSILPKRETDINMLISTALVGGRECEAILTNSFDIDSLPPMEPPVNAESVWSVARRLVEEATESPLRELYSLLLPTMGYYSFVKIFGNPGRATRPRMTTKSRNLYLSLIADLADDPKLARLKPSPTEQTASNLIDFQQMIGKK